MLTFELPSDEYRRRLRHALLKDLGDMKVLRKKNVEEEADVSDIDYKIKLIDGGKNGTPGLLQIFSTQGELFAADDKKADPAQMSIDDAIAESTYRDDEWVDGVPSPRPKPGERARALDGESLFVIVDPLGWERMDGNNVDVDTKPEEALFSALAVPIAKSSGFTADDTVKIYLQTVSVRDEVAEWTQVPSPHPDIGEIRDAVKSGTEPEDFEGAPPTVTDDQSTVTELSDFGSGEPSTEFNKVAEGNGQALEEAGITSPPPVESAEGNNSGTKPRGRKRAAAGNLAGAVKKEVARATGDRKINARKGTKK